MPIQATVGRPFPLLHPEKQYGRYRRGSGGDAEASSGTATATPPAATTHSAHVQPDDPHGSDVALLTPPPRCPGGGATEPAVGPVLPVGGSHQSGLVAHQWTAAELAGLQSGYFYTPVGSSSASATGAAAPTGEAYINLLSQCLRSAVRKHQQLAIEALLCRLWPLCQAGGPLGAPNDERWKAAREEAVRLKERCIHGPNCAAFLFFLMEVLASAGHPAITEMTAACLVLLLFDIARPAATDSSAVGAGGSSSSAAIMAVSVAGLPWAAYAASLLDGIDIIGSPAGDSPDSNGTEGSDDDERRAAGDRTSCSSPLKPSEIVDDPEMPFGEVSELLRGPDACYGLEQMDFTNKVLSTMAVLLDGDVVDFPDSPAPSSEREAGISGRASACPSSPRLERRASELLFIQLLLCGGVGVAQRTTCRRVAADPLFLRWVETQLSAVVLGQRPLEEVPELLCLLHSLAHVPVALRHLLSGGIVPSAALVQGTIGRVPGPEQRFYETWLLFAIYVCSTEAAEVKTVRQVSAVLWSMLLLREIIRHPDGGGQRLAADLSSVLMTDGMKVGGAMALEMWLLQLEASGATAAGMDSCFQDAARGAFHLSHSPKESRPALFSATSTAASSTAPDTEYCTAQYMLTQLQIITSLHYFSTYLHVVHRRRPDLCLRLCGTPVETQEAMQQFLRHTVMSVQRVEKAFGRLTSPLFSALSGSQVLQGKEDHSISNTTPAAMECCPIRSGDPSPHSIEKQQTPMTWVTAVEAVIQRWATRSTASLRGELNANGEGMQCAKRGTALCSLAFDSALLHANTRVASALSDTFPAVSDDAVLGYASLLVAKYEVACLQIRDSAAHRLQSDELSTMAEAVRLLEHLGTRRTSLRASSSTATGNSLTTPSSSSDAGGQLYYREAQVGAFFLLHSIAISKHCLDAAPLVLPLLCQLSPSSKPLRNGETLGDAKSREDSTALWASLLTGVEVTPVPAMVNSAVYLAIRGIPRSWVLHPLFDDSLSWTAKTAWARWMRALLGLHQRVKDVLGWDGVLSHVLLWVLSHRRWLFCGAASSGGDRDADLPEGREMGEAASQLAAALCDLLRELCSLLEPSPQYLCSGLSDPPSSAFSAAASRTLGLSLTSTAEPQTEDAMPLLLHAMVAYIVVHSEPSTALALVPILLYSPVSTAVEGSSADALLVCSWLQRWAKSSGGAAGATTMRWSLPDIVALLQLVGPHMEATGIEGQYSSNDRDDCPVAMGEATGPVDATLSGGEASDGCAQWCLLCAVEGLLQRYVRHCMATRGAPSVMEREVLRSTLEELDYSPSALRRYLQM